MSKATPPARYVALLRGVNVGGKGRLPMDALAACFAEAGASAVQTYIQSGNVVFAAAPSRAARVPALVEQAIRARFGFDAPVLLRSAAELDAVVRGNPYLAAGADPAQLHVAFLAEAPTAAAVAALDRGRSPPDAFEVRGREIYLRVPNGMGRTRLGGDWFERGLATAATVRSWRTVLALLARARG